MNTYPTLDSGAVPPKKPPKKPPRKPPLSPEAWARREAERFIAAQVAAIQEQQRIFLEELRRQAELRAKQGQALAAFLQSQNFPGRIQDLYRTAAGDVAGYAQGFAGDIRDIAAADAAEQANMLAGTGQEGAIRNEGVGMGDVLYGAYGWSPAKSFTETGAAYASDAALQPSFAARQAQQAAYELYQQGLGNLVEFAKAIAEAKGNKYALVQELMDRRRQSALEARKLRMEEIERQRDWAMKMAYYELARGNADRANQYLGIAQNSAMGLGPTGQPKPGYHIDPKSGLVVKDGWHHVRVNGVWVPRRDGSGSSGSGSASVKAQQKILQYADDIVRSIKEAGEEKVDLQTGQKYIDYPPYEELFNILWRRYESLLAGYKGATRRKLAAYLRDLIKDAMNQAGIYPRGKGDLGTYGGH